MASTIDNLVGLSRRFARDRRGGAAVVTALGLTITLGAAALAVDYARAVAARQALSSVADVAALAAVSRLPDAKAARKTALDYVEKNLPEAQHGQVAALNDIEIGTWNPETMTAKYEIEPDKETPLWNPHTQIIYYWTADEMNEERAYMIVYDGNIYDRNKSGLGSMAFRAVKPPDP